jgi:GTP-binding protein
LKIVSARLAVTAFRPQDEPRQPGPAAVFLGRSNVGKSSLINRLLGTRGLARTSSQPGKTQSVNFYRVNEAIHFVDLPGYGYARVPEAVRRKWGPLVEGFLGRWADRIALALVLVDARHQPTHLDRAMQGWLDERGIAHLIVATKTDKLSGNARAISRRRIRETMTAESAVAEPVMASAETGLGIREIWGHLDGALAQARGATWTSGN